MPKRTPPENYIIICTIVPLSATLLFNYKATLYVLCICLLVNALMDKATLFISTLFIDRDY